jgi:hypothetical protein
MAVIISELQDDLVPINDVGDIERPPVPYHYRQRVGVARYLAQELHPVVLRLVRDPQRRRRPDQRADREAELDNRSRADVNIPPG